MVACVVGIEAKGKGSLCFKVIDNVRTLQSMKVRDKTLGLQAAPYSDEHALPKYWRCLISLSCQEGRQQLKEARVGVLFHPGVIITRQLGIGKD